MVLTIEVSVEVEPGLRAPADEEVAILGALRAVLGAPQITGYTIGLPGNWPIIRGYTVAVRERCE